MPPLVQFGSSVNIDVVSIHPRLFRRGNKKRAPCVVDAHGFNPPPPFQARERYRVWPGWASEVSIHPRLFRRGNEKLRGGSSDCRSFNPPPPFQARERYNVKRVSDIPVVSIHPRLFRRGNALRQANDNRKVIRAVARTRLQLNSYAVNTPFPIK